MLGLSKIIVVGQCSHGKYFVWNRIIPAVWLDRKKKKSDFKKLSPVWSRNTQKGVEYIQS